MEILEQITNLVGQYETVYQNQVAHRDTLAKLGAVVSIYGKQKGWTAEKSREFRLMIFQLLTGAKIFTTKILKEAYVQGVLSSLVREGFHFPTMDDIEFGTLEELHRIIDEKFPGWDNGLEPARKKAKGRNEKSNVQATG